MSLGALHPVLQSLLDANIPVTVMWDEKQGDTAYQVPGFYKSGHVSLFLTGESYLRSVDRYGDEERIYTFEDLMDLNLSWWERANSYNINGDIPVATEWQEALLEAGLVTKQPIIRWRRAR